MTRDERREFDIEYQLLVDLREAVQAAQAATTPAEIGAAYEQLVGYDSHKEDPGASFEVLRADLLDYVREACSESGLDVADVGLTEEA